MSYCEKMFNDSDTLQEFSLRYFEYLNSILTNLDHGALSAFAEKIEEARRHDHTVFFIGNGGSAGTASHIVNDLGIGLQKNGSAPPPRVMSLTDNSPVMLAIANDEGYDNLFTSQLRIYYRPGDLLVAISASGNSPNVVKAAEWVRERGGKVISLTGFDGGRLKKISDIAILAETQKGDYGPVEDVHVIIGHLLANWLLLKDKGKGA